jgi:hypothetical protein
VRGREGQPFLQGQRRRRCRSPREVGMTGTPNPDEGLVEMVADFLHELSQWEAAYPLSAFPEPDLKRAAELLKAGGMALDAVSASNMRHVVSCLAPKFRDAIASLSNREEAIRREVREEAWQPIETAPKDGAEFQAWVVDEDGERGMWEPKCRYNPDTEAFEIWGRVDYDHDDWDSYYNLTPTHWQPLPAPPLSKPEGVG